jgi:polyisoprenoid-binding protein YceI
MQDREKTADNRTGTPEQADMSLQLTDSPEALALARTRWRLDQTRSSVEFHVPHLYGLMTVKGHFERYEGTLDRRSEPSLRLAIEADSLDSKQKKRDEHLRSADFFDVEHHPLVQFTSDSVTLDGEILVLHGQLEAAGKTTPPHFDATLRQVGDELEVEAITHADHRELGMTWSPLGVMRAPSKLVITGRLVRAPGA